MALSGKVETAAYSFDSGTRTVVLNWTATQDITKNQTTISWEAVGGGTYAYNPVVCELRITIDGDVVFYREAKADNKTECYIGTVLASGTKTITHNNDGTKSVGMSVEAGIYNWAINKSGSATFTLDTIARASSISSAGNVTLGNACSVQWTPASSSFTYKLKFSLGTWSYTTGTISPNTTSAYTYSSYTIPLTVANQLPSAATGTMTATLYTYNGSTQIGSTATKTFTVTVPSTVVPTLGTLAVAIVNDNSIINGWGVAVAGYTKVRLTADASGSYSSTISSFVISGSYSKTETGTSLNYTGDAISSSGSKTFTVVAKDSRGRSSASKTTDAITFYAYSDPKVSSFTAERSSSNVKQIVVKANWSFSSVNGKNAATGVLYYKKSTATNWTNYGEITKNTSTTLTATFEENASYNFKVVVTDSLSKTAQEETFVSTIEVTMDFRAGGKGLGIGKMAETDNLEIAFDTIFMGDVYIQKDDGTKVSLASYIQSIINGT